ncbi:hypothetical protein ACM9HF_04570 [Colwellia sp. RE-S-Sl-9]
MNTGNWDSAIIKSISYVSIIFSAYVWVIAKSTNDIFSSIGSLFLYLSFYLFFSILGWLFIGYPMHWLICKYTNKHYGYYVLTAFPLGLLFYFVFPLFYYVFPMYYFMVAMQILIFRLFVFKKAISFTDVMKVLIFKVLRI